MSNYSVEDTAAVLGALNALSYYNLFLFPSSTVKFDSEKVQSLMATFFEGIVNVGQLQMTAPPITAIAEYERLSEISHRHQAVPKPKQVGQHGLAPVFASSVSFENGSWTSVQDKYLSLIHISEPTRPY